MAKQITRDMSPRLPDFRTGSLSGSAWHGVTGSHARSPHTHLPASQLGLAADTWLNRGMQAGRKCRRETQARRGEPGRHRQQPRAAVSSAQVWMNLRNHHGWT